MAVVHLGVERGLQVICFLLFLLLAARLFFYDRFWLLIVCNTLTPYIYVPAYLLAALSLYNKSFLWLFFSLTLMGGHFLLLLRAFVPKKKLKLPTEQSGYLVHITSSNLFVHNKSLFDVTQQLLSSSSDILVLQEFSPQALQCFNQNPLVALYPYSFVAPRSDGLGLAVYSKFPILSKEVLYVDSLPLFRGEIQLPSSRLVLFNVHPVPPIGSKNTRLWNRYFALIENLISVEQRHTVIAGDFNMTPFNRWFLRFFRQGFCSGAPFLFNSTWPQSQYLWFPLQVDHILVSTNLGLAACGQTIAKGSDHKSIWAKIIVPLE